jgi:hypothetical protein
MSWVPATVAALAVSLALVVLQQRRQHQHQQHLVQLVAELDTEYHVRARAGKWNAAAAAARQRLALAPSLATVDGHVRLARAVRAERRPGWAAEQRACLSKAMGLRGVGKQQQHAAASEQELAALLSNTGRHAEATLVYEGHLSGTVHAGGARAAEAGGGAPELEGARRQHRRWAESLRALGRHDEATSALARAAALSPPSVATGARFLDKNRRYIGKSQSKRPPKKAPTEMMRGGVEVRVRRVELAKVGPVELLAGQPLLLNDPYRLCVGVVTIRTPGLTEICLHFAIQALILMGVEQVCEAAGAARPAGGIRAAGRRDSWWQLGACCPEGGRGSALRRQVLRRRLPARPPPRPAMAGPRHEPQLCSGWGWRGGGAHATRRRVSAVACGVTDRLRQPPLPPRE